MYLSSGRIVDKDSTELSLINEIILGVAQVNRSDDLQV